MRARFADQHGRRRSQQRTRAWVSLQCCSLARLKWLILSFGVLLCVVQAGDWCARRPVVHSQRPGLHAARDFGTAEWHFSQIPCCAHSSVWLFAETRRVFVVFPDGGRSAPRHQQAVRHGRHSIWPRSGLTSASLMVARLPPACCADSEFAFDGLRHARRRPPGDHGLCVNAVAWIHSLIPVLVPFACAARRSTVTCPRTTGAVWPRQSRTARAWKSRSGSQQVIGFSLFRLNCSLVTLPADGRRLWR